jgi:hypothetical protein
MNSYKTQSYQIKEMLDGHGFGGIDMNLFIKREMICQFFKDQPECVDGGTFHFSFIQFDWNSKPTAKNEKYHHVIEKCVHDQLNFYELTVNVI